LRRIRTL